MSLSDSIRSKALELGFDLVGIAPAGEARHADAFRGWLRAGHQAGMDWLARDPEARLDSRSALPGAASVVAVGFSYFVRNPPPEVWNDPSRGRIARYAWGQDYHDVLKPRLEALADFIRTEGGPGVRTRIFLDSGPLLERPAAEQAGLGFTGRNSLLINPDFGSCVFLGEIVTNLPLDCDEPIAVQEMVGKSPVPERCTFQPTPAFVHPSKEGMPLSFPSSGGVPAGRGGFAQHTACGECHRCLEACPTGAIVAEYTVDARRCISYQTIENKGSIPADIRPLMASWIFGCDECQDVCPWVKRYSKPKEDSFLAFDPDFAAPRLLPLLDLDEPAFRMRYLGSPIVRPRRRGFLRNVCVALGNWGSREALPMLEKAARDSEPLVREHAEWAIGRIVSAS